MDPNAHQPRRCRRCPSPRLLAVLCLAWLPWLFTGSLYASGVTRVATAPLPGPTDGPLPALIASYRGQALIISFWASWCEPCRREMPSLQRLAERWRALGLAVITVAVADQRSRIADFLSENELQLAVVDDRERIVSRAWGARLLPTTVVLDRRHRIRLRGEGAIDWDSPAIDQTLQPLMK